MAKLEPIDKISREFVAAVFSGWNGDLAFTPLILARMRKGEFDQVDVLEIVEDGLPTNVAKESAHETLIEISGRTVLGANLRVTLSYNPHLPCPCVVEVAAR